MRFITEFELPYPYTLDKPYAHMERAKCDMGQLIQETFEWKEKQYKKYNELEVNKWTLEIEAFPMDKWIEFKNKLWGECTMPCPNGTDILEMLKELESFGKPAGDAITNPQLKEQGGE